MSSSLLSNAPRFFVDLPLQADAVLALPAPVARHVKVRRLQPGAELTLFNGSGGEFAARVLALSSTSVHVQVGAHCAIEREAACAVHLAVGMPANERMDWLIEKATELGAASVQPLLTAHAVLRLEGERALKKQAHWQALALAACEQCGRNRPPLIRPVRAWAQWLPSVAAAPALGLQQAHGHWVLSPHTEGALSLPQARAASAAAPAVWLLSGPEGGLSRAEQEAAQQRHWQRLNLGARVLRADTAPLAALCAWTLVF